MEFSPVSLACVLVSDITGSTALFERLPEQRALAVMSAMLVRMRGMIEDAGGHCVKAKGDDILSFFDGPDTAFQAAWAMLNEPWHEELTVHAGLYFGEILSHAADIYGSAVNTAARLSSLAKPGEMLLGDTCFDDLSPENRARFTTIGALPLRGKEAAVRVFSCSVATLVAQTVVTRGVGGARAAARTFAAFSLGDGHWQLEDGGRLTIGRAMDSDILRNHPSVSRNHGEVAIRSGQLEFTDHSSTGSMIRLPEGQEIIVHRRTTLLSGSGLIFVGAGPRNDPGGAIAFSTGTLGDR